MGGKNWPPTAYNPDLKLWYIPVIESCNRITLEESVPEKLKAREFWTGGGPSQPFKITGSVMALDAKTLEKKWKFNTGGGVNAPPMTFMVDGKQYVAILVGLGGAWDKWFIDATPELKRIQPGSMLYVFAL